ncbi:hypothetical protein [Liquorilactobacillus sicerae]|uniref:hypothetical protein n=1 Tax=Liquorilactobacillus sicerae TaxID=1416943 RepID=UPI00247FC048|nr:hypothetical protein [Liquorilactobacillus sicerae]
MAYQNEFGKDIFKNEKDRLNAYCAYYAIDQYQLEKDPSLFEYVIKHQKILDDLIKGYEEMGPLNKKICSEFVSCECEVKLTKK